MRQLQDDRDRSWDVVVGRESWGAFFAIFVPRGHDAAIRQTSLDAGDRADAAREVDGMDREELLELLRKSRPKETG